MAILPGRGLVASGHGSRTLSAYHIRLRERVEEGRGRSGTRCEHAFRGRDLQHLDLLRQFDEELGIALQVMDAVRSLRQSATSRGSAGAKRRAAALI
jgi:hypothetical protein